MRFWKFLLPLLASTLCFAQQPDRIAGMIDSSQMVALPNHVSPLAQPRHEQGLIEASYPLRVTMLFTLSAAQQNALHELLAEQQNPKSANFHKWLTPEQYADRFGLSSNDIGKITAWLQAQGLKVVYVARGRDSVMFSGDAAQVQSALKTEIHRYDLNGKIHFSNSTSPMIPAALSGIVGGFRGLHNFVPKRMSVLHNPKLDLLHPDYTFTTTQGTFTALAPGDIAIIYDINPLYQAATPIDGANQKMVIVGQTDIYLADLNDFRNGFGLSSITGCTTNTTTDVITACDTTNFQFVIPLTAIDPGVNAGDLSESDLDIEWSGSVARNAQIIFVTSDYDSGGVFNSASWAIDNTLAPVISMSYGLCEAYSTPPTLTVQDQEFQKGASMGISIFVASGDDAAAICDGSVYGNVDTATLGPSVSYPASSPEVTAVGGTEFNEGAGTYWGSTNGAFGASVLPNGPLNGYIPELAWNDTATGLANNDGVGLDGTGGGPSNCVNYTSTITLEGFPFAICVAPPGGGFAKPAYQALLTPADSARDVPDISFSASNFNDPYIVCTAQSETNGSTSTSTCVTSINDALTTYNSAFGGTSVSTPVAAGMTVLLNQYLGTSGLGNINTQLYNFYSSNPSAFHDIIGGTSSTDGDTSDNIVPCTHPDPTFEPVALQCPSGGSFGNTAGVGYDLVTGLGSIDFNDLFTAWAASRASTTTAITTPSGAVNQGTNVTFTATVTPSTATGTVSFYDNASTTALGTSPISSGTATFSTTTLPAGSNSVVATYNGNGSDNVSTSPTPAVVVVTQPDFTLQTTSNLSPVSVPAGQSAIATLTLTLVQGTNETINFTNSASSSTSSTPGSCTAGLPAGALCTFKNLSNPSTPTSVTLTTASPSVTVQLTITTTANMAVPTGAQSITVTGTPSGTGATTHTANVSLTVTATNQTFAIASTNGATFPVNAGGAASVSIGVTGTNGFILATTTPNTTALPLTYSCTGLPSESLCTFSPNSGNSVSTVAVTLSISTTAPTGQLRPPLGRGNGVFYAMLLPGLFGIVFAAGSRTRGARLLSLIVVLGLSTLWLGACGGSSNSSQKNPGTPGGTYSVIVNATTATPSGGTALTSTMTVTLTVTN